MGDPIQMAEKSDLLSELDTIEKNAIESIAQAAAPDDLEKIRISILGRKGSLKGILGGLGKLEPEMRGAVGARANTLRDVIQEALKTAKSKLSQQAKQTQSAGVDVTLPGRAAEVGSRHPIYQVGNRMIEIFRNLGFEVSSGPEVEDEWHNFIGLNIPPDHIARDASENFYLTDDLLLRSQTSTVQIRTMENNKPPLRIVAPGKVYRPDTVDASHSYMFHQIEGLVVDEGISFKDLKATLLMFFRQLYKADVKIRLRPSFFPFTEPSAEVDMSCPFCSGDGCRICSNKGWIEMGGCGMVDPNVFEAVGYDPEKYTGFAFGMGIDRLTMVRHAIPDIRYIFENDIRFLEQFNF